MNLQDLTDNSRRILTALFQTPAARRQIADLCQLDVVKVSRDLNRLEGFGFVEKPSEFGGDWQISELGRRLFGGPVPKITATGLIEIAQQPQDSDPESDEPEPESDLELVREEPPMIMETVTTGYPQQVDPPKILGLSLIAEEQELNIALDEAITRLRTPRIPASTLRTYRRLLDALPQPVQKALQPITTLVESQP